MYEQGDNVLLKKVWKTKFNQDIYLGAYVINCSKAHKTKVMETFNIQNLTPYKE